LCIWAAEHWRYIIGKFFGKPVSDISLKKKTLKALFFGGVQV